MASTLLKAVKTALPECNKLPERAKEILNTVVRNCLLYSHYINGIVIVL